MLLKTKTIAFLGVFLALNQIALLLASIIETNTFLFFSIAGLIIGIVITEFGLRKGILFYIMSVILSFFLYFNKIELITYVIPVGLYTIFKYLIEGYCYKHVKPVILELFLKFIVGNILITIFCLIMTAFIDFPITWWLILIGEVAFFVYDYAFTIMINWYINNIKPKIKRLNL